MTSNARGPSLLLLAAGAWTLLGAVPPLASPAAAYRRFHADEPSEESLRLFQGAAGQTLLFAIGYLVAAFAPGRHGLVVALGGLGKAAYAVRLLREAAAGRAGPVAGLAAVGDLAFVAGFAALLARGRTWRGHG